MHSQAGNAEKCSKFEQTSDSIRPSAPGDEFFRKCFTQAAIGLAVIDPGGRFLAVNDAFCALTGYARSELHERDTLSITHLDDRPVAPGQLSDLVSRAASFVCEQRFVRKDNRAVWVETRISPLLDERGSTSSSLVVAREISEQKSAEQALRESEERYRDLVEDTQELICTHDLTGKVLSANRAAAELLGYDPGDYCGKQNLREILPADVRDQFDTYLARIRTDGKASGLMRVQTSSGEERIWEYHNTLRTEGVASPVVRGMAHDITERMRVEEALRESESFRRMIIEATPECVKLVGLDCTLLDMNPAGLAMIGASSLEQVKGHGVLELVAPEWHDSFREMHRRVCRGESVVGEFEMLGLDGERHWMETHAAPLRDKGSAVIAQLSITRDVTERKRAEGSLKLFRSLIDQCDDAIEVMEATTLRFLDCNQTAYATLGYTRDEFLSLSVFDIDAMVDDSMLAWIERELKKTDVATIESLHRRKDGSTFPVEINVKVVHLDKEYRLAVVRDITTRKHAEEALHRAEQRYREVFENAGEAIYVLDLHGKFASVNRAAEKLMAYSRQEILGRSFADFLAPEYLAEVRDNLCANLTLRRESESVVEVITKDQRRVPVAISTRLIYSNESPIAVQGTAHDISDRRRAEAASRQLAAIVESSHDGIASTTMDGTIVSWNLAAERIYGYSAREVMGRSMNILVPFDRLDEVTEITETLREDKSVSHFETMRATKEGKLIDVSLTISPIKDETGRIVGGASIIRDITEQKQAREQLRYFAQRLMQAQETERQSIARELHDEIGQVLTGVKINLQSLRRSPQTLPEARLKESIAVVDEALERVRELSFELRPSLLDDLGLPAALHWYVNRYGERTGIAAVVVDDGGRAGRLPRELETACFRIAQEALTNVARHSQATRVTVSLNCSADYLRLAIKDNGQGFAVDTLLANASSASVLGLRGMAERALAAEGQVEIDSAPEQGTEVRATFPLRPGR